MVTVRGLTFILGLQVKFQTWLTFLLQVQEQAPPHNEGYATTCQSGGSYLPLWSSGHRASWTPWCWKLYLGAAKAGGSLYCSSAAPAGGYCTCPRKKINRFINSVWNLSDRSIRGTFWPLWTLRMPTCTFPSSLYMNATCVLLWACNILVFCFYFGISIAPLVFTKVFALIPGLLRSQDIPIVGYLDDFLLNKQLVQTLSANV